MKGKSPGILKVVNFILAFLSIGLGGLFPFFKGAESIPVNETALYSTIFITFGVAFVLFALSYTRIFQKREDKKQFLLIANTILLMLWLFLAFIFANNYKGHVAQHKVSSVTKARIYKIDPEGYRKQRTLYYTFEFNGERYTGKKVNPIDTFNIGDSVNIEFSTNDPKKNRLRSRH